MGNSCTGAREKYEDNKKKGGEYYSQMQVSMKAKLEEAKNSYSNAKVLAREKYDEMQLKN